jgi:DNA-directed RNA polymerase subunit K/omega
MAIKTLDLGQLESLASSIYEACLIIAKRARSINGDRIAKRKEKEIIEETGYDQDMDVFDREFFEGIEYEREINPTVAAQEELFEQKVRSKYESTEKANEDKMPI